MNQIVQVRQIAQYPEKNPVFPDDRVLLQEFLGGPYRSARAAALVSTALQLIDEQGQTFNLNLQPGRGLSWEGGLNAFLIWEGGKIFSGSPIAAPSFEAAEMFTIGGHMVATIDDLNALAAHTVQTFNGRVGNVMLEEGDVLRAGAAPQRNAHFSGWITAPSLWNTSANDDTVATVNWVHRAIHETGVSAFNGRHGCVVLTTQDVNYAYAHSPPGVWPMAPTPGVGDASNRIATTLFVDDSLSVLQEEIDAIEAALPPPGTIVPGKPMLTANTTLYVNADTGNDANTGTVSSPFRTITHAWNVMCSYDLNGFEVTIQLQDAVAVYDALSIGLPGPSGYASTQNTPTGSGGVSILGNATDPSKTVVWDTWQGSSLYYCFAFQAYGFAAVVTIGPMTLRGSTDGDYMVFCDAPVRLNFGVSGGTIILDGTSRVSVIVPFGGSTVFVQGNFTVDLPTPQVSFVFADRNSYILFEPSITFSRVIDYNYGFYYVAGGALLAAFPSWAGGSISGIGWRVDPGGLFIGDTTPPPGSTSTVLYPDGFVAGIAAGVTVANLPTAGAPGVNLFVTDALLPAAGLPVSGGGTVFVPVFWNGTAWIVETSISKAVLTANLTIYVDNVNGNDANGGLSAGNALQTLLAAWDRACTAYEQEGYKIILQLQDSATPYGGLTLGVDGALGHSTKVPNGRIAILGNPSNNSAVTIDNHGQGSTGNYCFYVSGFLAFSVTIANVKLTSSGGIIFAEARSSVIIGDVVIGNVGAFGIVFGAAGDGAQMLVSNTVSIDGGLNIWGYVNADSGSRIQYYVDDTVVNGAVTVQGSMFGADRLAQVQTVNLTWSGPGVVTGPAYFVDRGGMVDAYNSVRPGGPGVMGPTGIYTPARAGVTVANLPVASTAGVRAMVTDAASPVFGSPVVGGGATMTPVFWNGSAWDVG